ncbi:glycosyltransferase [Psychroserpens sp. S379A]|uniref:glycosyltransferase n=1 Tax=Psychroserpens sp. S379A TaxID=3415137 RepID=UPI003C7E0D0B
MDKKIKITFVLPTLKPHGAEKIMSFVAQNLDKDKFEATLLIIGYKKDAGYKVEGIHLKFLNKSRVLNAIPSLFLYLKQNKQHVVISSISHLNLVMAFISLFFRKTKFIGREASVNSVMRLYSGNSDNSSNYYSKLIKNGYNWLDAIVCQSNDMVNDLSNNFKVKRQKLVLINNPITQHIKIKSKNDSTEIKKLITVGRLSKEKGYERILKQLATLNFPFQYTIIGDSDERSEFLQLIDDYKLTDNIIHIPKTDKVDDYLSASDLYLQGSYVEGFPNALLESCVVGTPVIAFDAPGGTKEIIQNDINGYLVVSEEDYSEKIKHSLFNKEWNPKDISESVQRRFRKEKILNQYEALFNQIINE